eukprot:gene9724-biopygen2869
MKKSPHITFSHTPACNPPTPTQQESAEGRYPHMVTPAIGQRGDAILSPTVNRSNIRRSRAPSNKMLRTLEAERPTQGIYPRNSITNHQHDPLTHCVFVGTCKLSAGLGVGWGERVPVSPCEDIFLQQTLVVWVWVGCKRMFPKVRSVLIVGDGHRVRMRLAVCLFTKVQKSQKSPEVPEVPEVPKVPKVRKPGSPRIVLGVPVVRVTKPRKSQKYRKSWKPGSPEVLGVSRVLAVPGSPGVSRKSGTQGLPGLPDHGLPTRTSGLPCFRDSQDFRDFRDFRDSRYFRDFQDFRNF